MTNPKLPASGAKAVAAATAVLLATTVAATPADATAARKITMYGGNAYGTSARVGTFVSADRTAETTMCTSASGRTRTNRTAALDIPGVGTVGAVSTRLISRRYDHNPVSKAGSRTAGFNLFGLIKASAVSTTARVERTSSGSFRRTGAVSFVGLTIAGQTAPPASPSANQTLSIPGVADIVLNRQVPTTGNGNYRMTVNAMMITIPSTNVLHLPAGRIIIGRSSASLHRPTYANPRGYAYGSSVSLGTLAGSGRTAAVYLPCGGSSGDILRNRLAKAEAPGAVATGLISSAGRSVDRSGATIAGTSNSVAGLRLLDGVVSASALTVRARAARHGSGAVHRSTSMTIGGLRINGRAFDGPVPVNTKIALPGVGTLWLHRVIKTRIGVIVRGVDLVLGTTTGGLTRGTEIVIGAAYAGAATR